MIETITCAGCGISHTYKKRGVSKKFCGKKCRETTWVKLNRKKYNESVRKYRARRYLKDGEWRDSTPKSVALKSWMVELKSNPCADCGKMFEVCCMDFDHKIGTVKSYNIGSMFAHHYSRELIETELAKCELVCANCHRIRTRNRRKGSRIKHHAIHSIPKNATPE